MKLPESHALQQYEPVRGDNITMPYIKSFYSCLNRIKVGGFSEDFEKTIFGIHSVQSDQTYLPKDFTIINFFRFRGDDKGFDNIIMYIIETTDGLKGTLVSSFDSRVSDNKIASNSIKGII